MKWTTLFLSIFITSSVFAKNKGLALSGGVSLGSYEAGVLYDLFSQDQNKLTSELKVVYGASAGSINGLLGIFNLCGFRYSSRESNLLWKMWIPVGLDQLEATDKKVHTLLHRNPIIPLFDELK